VRSSLVEEDKLELARTLEAKAAAKGVKLILPTDVVLADKFAADANTKVASVTDIPSGWMGLDNGPESTKLIQKVLRLASLFSLPSLLSQSRSQIQIQSRPHLPAPGRQRACHLNSPAQPLVAHAHTPPAAGAV
jgi:hypothetical protein